MPAGDTLHRFSVRALVPSPDLSDTRRGLEVRIHPAVQARLCRKYRTFRPEVQLAASVTTSFGTVRVEGRIDGLRRTAEGLLLYEIKPVPGTVRRWAGHPALQRARWQLQLYIELARRSGPDLLQGLPIVGGVLFLVDPSTRAAEEWVEFPPEGLLEQRLETVLAERLPCGKWTGIAATVLQEHADDDCKRDRPLQRPAWEKLAQREPSVPVLLSLPPGAGKTRLAVRYGLKHAVENRLPLFWITVKTRGRDEVLQEVNRYVAAGLPMRVLWKTAAHRLCDCDHSELCPRRERTLEHNFLHGTLIWRERSAWSPDDVADYARQHDLCGYELARQLEPIADILIADLNYFLDAPSLLERRAVTVFDEAQNVPERILQHSQVLLRREELAQAVRALPGATRERYRSLYAPQFLDEYEPTASAEQWRTLAAALRASSIAGGDTGNKIERLAKMLDRYPHNYLLRWYNGPDGAGWVGSLGNATVVLEDLLNARGIVLALSGSMAHIRAEQAVSGQGFEGFEVVTSERDAPPPVAVVPLLDFSHPISMDDHAEATEILRTVGELYGRTVAVFGQNRASNQILAMRLHVRGFSALQDADLGDDWSTAEAIGPDFLFVSLGSNLSEAVNPPPDLFSCGVVLAPGFRPPDIFDYLQRATDAAESNPAAHIPESVSRVVQAAGRLQRSPQQLKPVLLVNKSFARPDYLRLFPRDWYQRKPEELLFENLKDAQVYLSQVRRAR